MPTDLPMSKHSLQREKSLGGGLRGGIVFFSLLIFFGGAAILGSSVWTFVTVGAFQSIIGVYAGIFVSVYLNIVVGTLMFIIAFFGCAGAMFEKKRMLYAYCCLLIVFFLAQVISSVLAFVYYPLARDASQNSMRKYDNDTTVQEGWDTIQGVLECCGVNSYSDWKQRESYPVLPRSCCFDKVETCNEDSRTRFLLGCDAFVERFFVIIASIGFSLLPIELLTIALVGYGIKNLTV